MTIFSRSELKRCGDLFSFKQIGQFSPLLLFLTKVQGLPFYFLMGSDADKEGKTCTSSFRRPHTSFTFRCHFLTEHESEPRGGAGVSYPGENGGCSMLPSSQATMELFRVLVLSVLLSKCHWKIQLEKIHGWIFSTQSVHCHWLLHF